MRVTVRAVADEIASAAELALGKVGGRPAAIVRGADPPRGEGSIRDALMPAGLDLFRGSRRLAGREARPPDPLVHLARRARGASARRSPGSSGPPTTSGFDSIWVMDHFFQIRGVGRPRSRCSRAGRRSAAWRPTPSARASGSWSAASTTATPGSGSRPRRPSTSCPAGGPGSASARPGTRRRSGRLGFPFPPLGERFELLEDTLRIAHGMWQGEHGSEAALRGPPLPSRRGC